MPMVLTQSLCFPKFMVRATNENNSYIIYIISARERSYLVKYVCIYCLQ